MKRRNAGMAAVLIAAILFLPCRAEAVSARSAIVLDAQTGRVLYEKNADKKSLIASTTKIMTALIVCEQCNVLDRVRIPKEAVGIEGSSMYLTEGEILTVQELLYGLMLHSGNDAAVALAIYCGGTVEGFAGRMNDKARMLGMADSHFENPNGLDSPGHYSTARDMAVLAAYAMKNPIFAQTVSTKSITLGKRTLRNHNKMLWQVEGADGVKTGFTKAAGRILVSSASRQGRRIIVVTFHDPNDWVDHKTLINQGFSEYQPQSIIEKGACVGEVWVADGRESQVELIAGEGFTFSLAQGEKPEIVLSGPGFVYAPVAQGQKAGFAYIMLKDSIVGKVPIYYGRTVECEERKTPTVWEKIFGGDRQ